MDDSDDDYSDFLNFLYDRLTAGSTMRASDYENYSDDDDDSLSYINGVSGSDDEDITTTDDYDSNEDMTDEDDNLSDASTVLNEGHQQPSQSGTDTEVEADQEEVEDSEDEPIVQSQKKIKLDEPKPVIVQDAANESMDEDQKCPICLETWSNAGEHRLCSLRCGHLFGLKCITQWFNIAQNATARKCPECNTKASKKDIRVIYAKKLQCIDTSEIEQLKEQLKEVREKKDIAEKELKQYQTRETLYQQEISNLRLKVDELKKKLSSLSSENNTLSVQCENIILKKYKVFDICTNGSCRAMAYNPWHKILVVSAGNGISRVFIDTLSACVNQNIHSGTIRDLAFQEQHPNILLSVAFDKKIMLTDIRSNILTHSYQEETNLWSCCWSNVSSQTFFVGDGKGTVAEYDVRYLQSAMSVKKNFIDGSPVVSLASVPTSSPALRAGGYIACQLNSCSAYRFNEGNYDGNQINIEGPFTSLKYNNRDNHVLLSCRASAKNPFVRHMVCTIEKNEDKIQFNPVHTFNAGNSLKLLSRPCYMNLKNDTLVVANNENRKSITSWSISTGQESYSIPISESVVDVCSFENNVMHQAILTLNKLHLYHHKDTNA